MTSAPGQGSTFTLRLPAADASAEVSAVQHGPRLDRVVLVDDDPGFRALMRSLLGGFCERIEEFADGRSALVGLRRSGADAVFLDLVMPDLDGTAVLTAMAADDSLGDIPVVVVSSLDVTLGELPGAAMRRALLRKQDVTRDAIDLVLRSIASPGTGER